MLGFYFVIAIAATYPLCISGLIPAECMHQQEQECDQALLPRAIPTTVDQLRDMCRNVQELGACIIKVYEKCMGDHNGEIGGFREITNYIGDICKEDSEVFQAISSNLQCVASNIPNGFVSCQALTFSEPTKVLINNLHKHANRSQEEIGRHNRWCLDTLWRAYCLSAKASISCGFEVGAAIKSIMLTTSGSNDAGLCSPEYLAEVTPMLETIEVAIVEEENLKKMEEETSEEGTRRKRRFASPLQPFYMIF